MLVKLHLTADKRPDRSIDRIFTSTFYFPHKVTKASQIKHIYRNPIYLARKYKQMMDNDQVRNQSDLARKLGISTVRIHQMLNLLKLDYLIIQELEKLGDPLNSKTITDRMLRPYVNKSFREQKELLNILKNSFLYKDLKKPFGICQIARNISFPFHSLRGGRRSAG